MKKLLPLIALVAAVYVGWDHFASTNDSARTAGQNTEAITFNEYVSGTQVEGNGIVIRVLPDDSDGSRHQRFILKLASGQTVLVAHNIDLAPRVDSLREGDTVAFYGEYEWNAKGGVVHWTHRDPDGQHAAGWLKYKGQTYQ